MELGHGPKYLTTFMIYGWNMKYSIEVNYSTIYVMNFKFYFIGQFHVWTTVPVYNKAGQTHEMEAFSTLLDLHWSLVDSPHKGTVLQSFDVFFIIDLNKLLNRQSTVWWFEML